MHPISPLPLSRALFSLSTLIAFGATPVSVQAVYSDQTAASGLVFTTSPSADAPGAAMWGGVSVGDFNNDGWPDIFVASGGGGTDGLFINQGNGLFVNQGAAWGFTDLYRGNGTAVGDYDNDGDLDIYVTGAGDMSGAVTGCANRLYRNNFAQGSSTFTEVGAAAGVHCTTTTVSEVFPEGAAFGDYDLDGDLDLFAANWGGPSGTTNEGNRLFRNNGDGTFTDVTVAAGVFDINIHGFTPRFTDMNGDRYPELLISADYGNSRYFKNNGDGTFTDMTVSAGVGLDQNGMGGTMGDFNQDGLFDWYVTAIEHKGGNFVYVNQGNNNFSALPASSGAKNGGWGWGAVALDYDNDGDVDIAETNGWFAQTRYLNIPTYMFRNDGDLTFTKGQAGIDNFQEGRTLITLDYDRDGDLDIVMSTNNNMAGGPLYLYQNQPAAPANWLEIQLDPAGAPGIAPNGVGSVARIKVNGVFQYFNLSGGSNFLGHSELIAHFGLGASTNVEEVLVQWSNGDTTVLTNVSANQLITVSPSGSSGGPDNITINDVTVTEGDSGTVDATFQVRVSSAASTDVTVDYVTADVTATSGSDYTGVSGTVTIPAGTTSAPVTVPVIGDTLPEPSESFLVELSNAAGGVILDGTGIATILDNDTTTSTALLDDDFEDGIQTWVAGGSQPVTETGGTLQAVSSGGRAWAVAPTPWTPSGVSGCDLCTVETGLTWSGGSARVGIFGWFETTKRYFLIEAEKRGWTIQEINDRKKIQKKAYRSPPTPGVEYQVKAVYDGSTITVYIDGVLRLTMTPKIAPAAGNFGVQTRSGTGIYSYIKVY